MLPLLALRQQPTSAALSDDKVEVELRFAPPGTVTLTTRITGDITETERGWVLAWVGSKFGRGANYKETSDQWTMSHPAFSAAVRSMNRVVNTPGTYSNTTTWTIETNEQTRLDTDGTQILRLVFAID
jgi:hypothetical protein